MTVSKRNGHAGKGPEGINNTYTMIINDSFGNVK